MHAKLSSQRNWVIFAKKVYLQKLQFSPSFSVYAMTHAWKWKFVCCSVFSRY